MEPILNKPIVNKVAGSPIRVFNLEDLWDGADVVEFDIAQMLDQGLILREKTFRAAVATTDWSTYTGKHVALRCTTDAIVPVWAFMLVASALDGVAKSTAMGTAADLARDRFVEAIDRFDWSRYDDALVVVKGCGSGIVPMSAYVAAMNRLQAVARKLMFGEACSSVPLWRRTSNGSKRQSA